MKRACEHRKAPLSVSQRVKNTLTQQREFSPSKHHSLNKLQFVHFSFHQTIVVRKRQPCDDSGFVTFNAKNKALKFTDLTFLDFGKPLIELFTFEGMKHLAKFLHQLIGDSCRL